MGKCELQKIFCHSAKALIKLKKIHTSLCLNGFRSRLRIFSRKNFSFRRFSRAMYITMAALCPCVFFIQFNLFRPLTDTSKWKTRKYIKKMGSFEAGIRDKTDYFRNSKIKPGLHENLVKQSINLGKVLDERKTTMNIRDARIFVFAAQNINLL